MSSGKSEESAAPSPCAKGCGFFGSAATRGMCSVCFKKHSGIVSDKPAVGATSSTATVCDKAVDVRSAAATMVIKPVAQGAVPPPGDVVPAPDRGDHEQPQESGTSPPCANGCGFFGSAATGGMCSVCFKKCCVLISEEPSTSSTADAAAVVIKPDAASAVVPKTAMAGAAASEVASSSAATEAGKDVSDVEEARKKAWKARIDAEGANGDPWKNLCTFCFKKLGLIRFECRCGNSYCPTHRLPEEHACGYDYVGKGRAIIARNNPVSKGEKLRDRI